MSEDKPRVARSTVALMVVMVTISVVALVATVVSQIAYSTGHLPWLTGEYGKLVEYLWVLTATIGLVAAMSVVFYSRERRQIRSTQQ